MEQKSSGFAEKHFVKTKIIATVGPACGSENQLRDLVVAGVDIFRLNFAHGEHEWLAEIVRLIHKFSDEMHRPIGILGDLSGPKIRLGNLPEDGIVCHDGAVFEFVRKQTLDDPSKLTCTYEQLIDDLGVGDHILLADGTVGMRVIEKPVDGNCLICRVDRPGLLRSRQGINLPGVLLSTPSLTEKDRVDLTWAVDHKLDYVGLSFVRSPKDIRELKAAIADLQPVSPPQVVAKIEKMEAVSLIESILEETDAVMVARGDLGVEVDIARVPVLQKRIIRLCNQHRIPVITATQMLDSMESNESPTRAEASDVANAVLDGSDAIMLSGETAIGQHPVKAVEMMSRIANEAERLVRSTRFGDMHTRERSRSRIITEAVTLAAGTAAEHLEADLIAVTTHSGRAAMAISKQRSRVPILAMSNDVATARRMSLYWGVTPLQTGLVDGSPQELIQFIVEWGKREKVLSSGSRIVIVGNCEWTEEGHDLLLVHAIP